MNLPDFSESSECEDQNNIDNLLNLLSSNKRTKLHKKDVNSWLLKRSKNKAKIKYLYYPEELLQHQSIKEIFQSFDRDGSGGLDIDELVKMFSEFNIQMSKNDLKKLFDVVDSDGDNALNFTEFKNCTLSEKAERVFNQIMKKVKEEDLKRPLEEQNVYLPYSFGRMVSHISYQSMRRDVLDILKKNQDVHALLNEFNHLFSLQSIFKSDVKIGNDQKLKQKIRLKNTNVEPLLRQISNISAFRSMNNQEISKIHEGFRKSIELESDFLKIKGEFRKSIRGSHELIFSHKSKQELLSEKTINDSSPTIPSRLNFDSNEKKKNITNFNLFSDQKNNDKSRNENEETLDEIKETQKSAEIKGVSLAKNEFKNIKNTDKFDSSQIKLEIKDIQERIKLPFIKNIKRESFSVSQLPKYMKNKNETMNLNANLEIFSLENQKFQNILDLPQVVNRKKINDKFSKYQKKKIDDKKEIPSFSKIKNISIINKLKEINFQSLESRIPIFDEIKKIQKENFETKKYKPIPELPKINEILLEIN